MQQTEVSLRHLVSQGRRPQKEVDEVRAQVRLNKDYEPLTERRETVLSPAMIHRRVRRLRPTAGRSSYTF